MSESGQPRAEAIYRPEDILAEKAVLGVSALTFLRVAEAQASAEPVAAATQSPPSTSRRSVLRPASKALINIISGESPVERKVFETSEVAKTEHDYVALTAEALKKVRASIGTIGDDGKVALHQFLEKVIHPNLSDTKQQTEQEPDSNWADWLTASDDPELIAFIKWNAERIKLMQQDPYVKRAIEREKAYYCWGMRKAVKDGWISDVVLDELDLIERTEVRIGDFFHMELKDTAGVYYHGSFEVIVQGGTGAYWPLSPTTIPHEFSHRLFWKKAGQEFDATWLHEALTEHVAQSLLYGKPNIVYPKPRKRGSYMKERELLDILLNWGNQRVDASLATLAYSGTHQQQLDFRLALGNSWNFDVLPFVNQYVSAVCESHQREGLSYGDALGQAADDAKIILVKLKERANKRKRLDK